MLQQEWANPELDRLEATAPPQALPRVQADKPEASRPFSEFSGGVSRALLISWGLFALVVIVAFAGKLDVLFNLGIVMTFGAVFFGVPLVLLRIKRAGVPPPKTYVDTPNGRMSQSHVMIQIVMVPLILSVGMALIGYFATHQ